MNTMRSIVGAVLFAALVPAQGQEGAAALARARVLEEREGDGKGAAEAYAALLAGSAEEPVKAEAALRYGALLWRMEKKDEARAVLARAIAAGGEVGKQAQAVLDGAAQGQGDAAKAARAKELVARAVELSRQYPEKGDASAWRESWDRVCGELRWTGEAGAKAVVERVYAWHSLARLMKGLSKEAAWKELAGQPEARLIGLLWRLGTQPTQEYLRTVATGGDLGLRRACARGCEGAVDELLPIAAMLLRDQDPDGEVQFQAAKLGARFAAQVLFDALADPSPQVRAAALAAFRLRWENVDDAARGVLLPQLGPAARRSLHADHPREVEQAGKLFEKFAQLGPREARTLLFAELPALSKQGSGFASGQVNPGGWLLDDSELRLLTEAAKSASAAGRAVCASILQNHQPEWTAAGIDSLLDLAELAGLPNSTRSDSPAMSRLMRLATPAHLARFVRLAPKIGEGALSRLSGRALPAEVFPAARDLVEQILAAPRRQGWFERYSGSYGRNVRGRQVAAPAPGQGLLQAIQVVGRTGAAEAPAWLLHLLDPMPEAADDIAMALVDLSIADVGEPARAAMRRMLVWKGTDEAELSPASRTRLFAELTRIGDVPAIELFPEAFGLGLEADLSRHPLMDWGRGGTTDPRKVPTKPRFDVRGLNSQQPAIACLAVFREMQAGRDQTWHGYDDANLHLAWRTLLRSEHRNAVLRDIGSVWKLPDCALPDLSEALFAVDLSSLEPNDLQGLCKAVERLRGVDLAAIGRDATLRATLEKLFGWRDLAWVLVRALDPAVCHEFSAPILALAAKADGIEPMSLQALARADIQLPTAVWLRLLRAGPQYQRMSTIPELPAGKDLDPALARAVEQLAAADPATEVRVAACKALGRWLSTDSVAALLRALHDPAEDVRKEATAALQAIRFYQEQGAHWQQVGGGVEVTKANATAKLVLQAKSGPHEQRLLAIVSLGALGAPEALPYLIDWTLDPDAELARAAREACAAIHQKAGAAK